MLKPGNRAPDTALDGPPLICPAHIAKADEGPGASALGQLLDHRSNGLLTPCVAQKALGPVVVLDGMTEHVVEARCARPQGVVL